MNILKKAGIGLLSAGVIASIAAFGLNNSGSRTVPLSTEETTAEPRASSHLLHPPDANGNVALDTRYFMTSFPYVDLFPDPTKEGMDQSSVTYKYSTGSTTGTMGLWGNRPSWPNVSFNYSTTVPKTIKNSQREFTVTGVKAVYPYYLEASPFGVGLTYGMVSEPYSNSENRNLRGFQWSANPSSKSVVGSGAEGGYLYVASDSAGNTSKIKEVFQYTSNAYNYSFTFNPNTFKTGIDISASLRGVRVNELNKKGTDWDSSQKLAKDAQDDAMSIIMKYQAYYGKSLKEENKIHRTITVNGKKVTIYNWYWDMRNLTPPPASSMGNGGTISGAKSYSEWLTYWKSYIVNSNVFLFQDIWNQQYQKTISYSSYRLYMPLLMELNVKSSVDFEMVTENTDTSHNPNNQKCSAEFKDGRIYVDLVSVLSNYPFDEEVSTVTLTISDRNTGTKYYQGKSNVFEHTINKPVNLAQAGVSFSQIASSTLSNPTKENGKFAFTVPQNFSGKELCIEAVVNASNYPVETDDRTNNVWKDYVKVSVPDLIFKSISHRVISETKTSFTVTLNFKTRDEKTKDLTISQSPVKITGSSNATSVSINKSYNHPFKEGDYIQTIDINVPKIGKPGASQTITLTGVINPNKNAPLVPTVEQDYTNNSLNYTFTLVEEEEEDDIPTGGGSSIPNIDELPTDVWREQCVISLNKDKTFYNLMKQGTFIDSFPASILSFTEERKPGPYMQGTLVSSTHNKFIMSAYPCEDAYSDLLDYYYDEQRYVHFKGYTTQFFTNGSTELKDAGTARKLTTKSGSRCPEYERWWCDNCEEYHTRHDHYLVKLMELTEVSVQFKIKIGALDILDLYDFESRDSKIRAGYGFYTKIQTSYSTDMDVTFQKFRRYDAKGHISRRIDVKTDKLNMSGSIIQLDPAGGEGIFPTVFETRHNKQSKYQHRKTFMNENTPDGDYPVYADIIVALPSFSAYVPNDPCATKVGTKYLGTYAKDYLTVVGSMYDDSYPTVGKTDSDK